MRLCFVRSCRVAFLSLKFFYLYWLFMLQPRGRRVEEVPNFLSALPSSRCCRPENKHHQSGKHEEAEPYRSFIYLTRSFQCLRVVISFPAALNSLSPWYWMNVVDAGEGRMKRSPSSSMPGNNGEPIVAPQTRHFLTCRPCHRHTELWCLIYLIFCCWYDMLASSSQAKQKSAVSLFASTNCCRPYF